MFASESGAIDIRGKLVAANFPVSAAAPVLQIPKLPDIFNEFEPTEVPHVLQLAGSATEQALEFFPDGMPVDAIVFGGQDTASSGHSFKSVSCSIPGSRAWPTPLQLVHRILEQRGHGPLDERNLISIHNVTVSSNQAIGMAFHRIRSGHWKRAVVTSVHGGCGARELMNFHMLGTLTTDSKQPCKASRPFSKSRSGFVMGEGAATLVLETRTAAERRGANILGMVTGYATTSDAYRITDGHPEAASASVTMQKAIHDAGLSNAEIDAISAHGTSTRMNDRIETMAIKHAFGPAAYQLPITSLKSQIGHCLAAAGALEAVASLLMLSEQKLAPTINYSEADPECDLDYVPNRARPARLQRILSNNFGFGGQNTSVVFENAPSNNIHHENSHEHLSAFKL
jgi:3-oxoacyl-[acyl-carrier-protein] synthase II